MLINDKELESYDADLLNKDITIPEVKNKIEWEDHWHSPIFNDQHLKYVTVTCEILLQSENNAIAEKNISRLVANAKIAELKFNDLDLTYYGYLETLEKEKIMAGKYILSAVWICQLPYEEKVSKTISSSTTIILNNTGITPCILEVTPLENIGATTITGLGEDIILNNLTAGSTIIIDGEKGLVTENGQNKFPDYDSWGFPKLSPGENNITIDTDTLDIVVKYKPRWI